MPDIAKYRPGVISDPLRPREPGPGGAVAGVAADAFGRLAAQVGDLADRAAVRAGAAAGSAAGLDPGYTPVHDNTLYGEAYAAAALRTAAVEHDTAIAGQLADLYETAKNDPQAFQAGVEDIRARSIDTLPTELRAPASASFGRSVLGYSREIARTAAATTLSQQADAAKAYLANREVEGGRLAYQLGIDRDADETLSAFSEETLGKLLAFGPKEAFSFGGKDFAADASRAGLFSPDAIGDQMRALAETATFNRVKGAFDRAGGLDRQAAFLTTFRADWAKGEGVAGAMSLKTAEALESWMETSIRQGLADARAGAAAVKSEIADIRSTLSDYRSFAGQALAPPPGVIDALKARARATGDAKIIAEVDGLEALTDLAANAVKADPASLQDAIAERRARYAAHGASPQEAAELGLLETTLTGMTTALAKDPLSYAVRAGVVQPPPLAVGVGADGAVHVDPQSLAARRPVARLVSQTYGVPFRPFTDEEAGLAKTVEQAGGDAMLSLMQGLATAFGSDAGDALKQISDKAPVLGHVGALLATGSPLDVARAAARGQQLIAEKGGDVSTLTAANKASTIGALNLDAIFADDPHLRATIEKTADAIYVGRHGLAGGFDAEDYRNAVQEAAGAQFIGKDRYGGLSTYRKHDIVLPGWLRADQLDNVLRDFSGGDYVAAGHGFGPVDAAGQAVPRADLRDRYLVSTGDPGQYYLAHREGGVEVFDATKDPKSPDGRYVLDLDSMRSWVALWGGRALPSAAPARDVGDAP
jgi:hypothetical protein